MTPIPGPGAVTIPESWLLVLSPGGVMNPEGCLLVLLHAPAGVGIPLCLSPLGSWLSVSERDKKTLVDIYNMVKMVERKKNTNRGWTYFWCTRLLHVQLLDLGRR